MPLFSLSVGKQQQAAASGVSLYPQTLVPSKGVIIGDNFDRETLHPTGAIQIYKEETNGAGSSKGNTSGRGYLMTSGNADGDYVTLRTQNLKFSNNNNIPHEDESTVAVCRIRMSTSGLTLTSSRIFAGLLFNNESDFTTFPSTAKHVGMVADYDADTTRYVEFSHADGSTQTKDTSAYALGGDDLHEFQIEWRSWNDFIFRYFRGGTEVYTASANNILSLDGTDRPWDLKAEFAVMIESTIIAAQSVKVLDWQVEFK